MKVNNQHLKIISPSAPYRPPLGPAEHYINISIFPNPSKFFNFFYSVVDLPLSTSGYEKEVTYYVKRRYFEGLGNINLIITKGEKMEEEEDKKTKGKTKKKKEKGNSNQKKRIFVHFNENKEASEKFRDVLEKTNAKDYGAEVTASDVFSKAIHKISDADIRELQRESIHSEIDLLKFEWSKDQSKSEQLIDFNSWLVSKLKLKSSFQKGRNNPSSNSN